MTLLPILINHMTSLIRDQAWGFWGAVFPIIGYLISQFRDHKEISYLAIDGRRNNNPFNLIILKIWNTGNKTILPGHYSGSFMEVSFRENARMQRFCVPTRDPQTMRLVIDPLPNGVNIRPFTFKSRASFIVEILLEQAHSEDISIIGDVDAEIINVSEQIVKLHKQSEKLLIASGSLLTLWILCMLIYYRSSYHLEIFYYINMAVAFLFCLTAAQTLITLITIYSKNRQNVI